MNIMNIMDIMDIFSSRFQIKSHKTENTVHHMNNVPVQDMH